MVFITALPSEALCVRFRGCVYGTVVTQLQHSSGSGF